MEPVRWGVLGCARIAERAVIPAIVASQGARLVALSARDGARAAAWAARFGAARAHEGYDALLADPEVEAVYVPVPTAVHAEWTLKAIEAGKHVLCEKPIAMTAREIDRIIAARDAAGLVVGEALMVAHHPQWAQVREWIEAGEIGTLRCAQGVMTGRNLDPKDMRNRPELGGGALLDAGTYPISTARIASGAEPRSARARIDRDPAFGIDRFVSATLDFDGFELSFHVSTQLAERQSMTFHGETGWVEVSAPFNSGTYAHAEIALHRETREGSLTRRFGGADQYRLMIDDFARSAREGGPLAFPLESSRASQAAIDACFAAGANGGCVDI